MKVFFLFFSGDDLQCAKTWKKVHFGRTMMHCLPQRPKSMFLEKFRVEDLQRRGPRVKKKIKKSLILVFEVIIQPLKHTFESGIFPHFSSLCYIRWSFFCSILTRFLWSKTRRKPFDLYIHFCPSQFTGGYILINSARSF